MEILLGIMKKLKKIFNFVFALSVIITGLSSPVTDVAGIYVRPPKNEVETCK